MPRNTELQVLVIMQPTTLKAEDITPFLKTAAMDTDERCAPRYTEDRCTEIELYYAAHNAAIRSPRKALETIGPQSATYEGQFGTGLKATSYGQRVMLLDYLGLLSPAADGEAHDYDMQVFG